MTKKKKAVILSAAKDLRFFGPQNGPQNDKDYIDSLPILDIMI